MIYSLLGYHISLEGRYRKSKGQQQTFVRNVIKGPSTDRVAIKQSQILADNAEKVNHTQESQKSQNFVKGISQKKSKIVENHIGKSMFFVQKCVIRLKVLWRKHSKSNYQIICILNLP